LVLAWLNADPDIAFLVPDGPGRWRASRQVPELPDGTHALWHVPGGPLPVIEADGQWLGRTVADPFRGWTELRRGGDPTIPWLGDPACIIHMGLWPGGAPLTKPRVEDPADQIGTSSFSWIGNQWAATRGPASPATSKWWQRLRRWIQREGVALPEHIARLRRPMRTWAFPDAFAVIMRPQPPLPAE